MQWINANQRHYPNLGKPKKEAAIDKQVSEIVGKEIRVNDSRLIQLVVKWKKEKAQGDDDFTRDDFLYDETKVKELKEAFK